MDKERIEWTHQPADAIYGEEVRLPSFGINVTRSDPSAMAVPAGWGTADLAVDSGDAFSISYLHHLKGQAFSIDRKFEGVFIENTAKGTTGSGSRTTFPTSTTAMIFLRLETKTSSASTL